MLRQLPGSKLASQLIVTHHRQLGRVICLDSCGTSPAGFWRLTLPVVKSPLSKTKKWMISGSSPVVSLLLSNFSYSEDFFIPPNELCIYAKRIYFPFGLSTPF